MVNLLHDLSPEYSQQRVQLSPKQLISSVNIILEKTLINSVLLTMNNQVEHQQLSSSLVTKHFIQQCTQVYTNVSKHNTPAVIVFISCWICITGLGFWKKKKNIKHYVKFNGRSLNKRTEPLYWLLPLIIPNISNTFIMHCSISSENLIN